VRVEKCVAGGTTLFMAYVKGRRSEMIANKRCEVRRDLAQSIGRASLRCGGDSPGFPNDIHTRIIEKEKGVTTESAIYLPLDPEAEAGR